MGIRRYILCVYRLELFALVKLAQTLGTKVCKLPGVSGVSVCVDRTVAGNVKSNPVR